MTRWDAARAASRRPLTKPHKMMGPVGEKRFTWGERLEESWMPDDRPTERYSLPNARVEAVNDLGTPQYEVTACKRCGYHVCSCAQMVNPMALEGRWPWAILQMVEGKTVKREAWGASFIRMRYGEYESMGDTTYSSHPGEWTLVAIEESEFSAHADYIVVPSDDPSVHLLINAAANRWSS